MRERRGFTLLETIFALGLSMLVLLAVEVLFVDSLRFRLHNDQLTGRTLENEVLDLSTAVDVAETDLSCSTVMVDGVIAATIEMPSQPSMAPAPLPAGTAKGLTALALPRARDRQTNDFRIDPQTCVPLWQSLRITYLRGGEMVLREIDVAPADGQPVTAAIDAAALQALCEDEVSSTQGWVRIAGPKVLSRQIERLRFDRLHRQVIWSDNEPVDEYALFVTVRRNDTRREGGPATRLVVTRLYRSWNSTFRDPGPIKSPMPVPIPPSHVDAGRNEW